MSNEITLGEEDISGVTLATFHVFDKEYGRTNPRVRFAAGGGGCGGCAGCAGCATGTVSGPSTYSIEVNPPRHATKRAHKHTRTLKRKHAT